MSKIIFYSLAGIALTLSAISASATTTVATVPDAMVTLSIVHGVTNYLSLPLTQSPVYTTTVTSVSTNTITVGDTPAPFTSSLLAPGMPYFVKFLSGSESGRVLLITGNLANTLTVDTTDNVSGEAIALTTTGFSVLPGDTFEVFPGDTLASIFGDASAAKPLVIAGGASSSAADAVTLYTSSTAPSFTYYFNTKDGFWESISSSVNANNTIIYPYSAFTVTRQSTNPDTTITLSGRVTQVAPTVRLADLASVFTGTHFATDVTLSQLQFANWARGASAYAADTISVWNSAINSFDIYFQKPDYTWRKYPDNITDQSNFVIAAGTVATIAKKTLSAGGGSFVQGTSLPYSLQ